MWDLQCVMRLEKWKLEYGGDIPNWLKTIGEFDAFCSLGNYAYNNPNYTYPEIDNKLVVSAKEMGHPLLNGSVRVDNDFEMDEKGRFIIITGALQ